MSDMAVDVGHGGKSGVEEEVWVEEKSTEDDRDNQGQTTSHIYQAPAFIQVPYLNRIFPNPYLSIKPSTLTNHRDFFL